jgi:asparagine synthetase B (glutamine-hydrolysing)
VYARVCNTLSGGVDSSYLQALLLKERQPYSFSIQFDVYGRDNDYARDVANQLGTTHDAMVFTSSDFLRLLERGVRITQKPYIYQGEAMFLKLYAHIAERCRGAAVVSGQTADGALASAPSKPIQLALRSRMVPHPLVDLILRRFTDEWRGVVRDLRGPAITAETMRRIERYSRRCRTVAEYLGFEHDVFIHTAEMANGFAGGTDDKLAKAHLYSGEMRRIPSVLHALAAAEGLAVAFPFLDPTFLEYTLSIPASLKQRKYLGKKLATRYVTPKYVRRAKLSKQVPYQSVFKEAEWSQILNVIRNERYFGFDVDTMIARQDHALILRLVNFHLWTTCILDFEHGDSGQAVDPASVK